MQIQDTNHVDVSVAWGGFIAGVILWATNLSPVFPCLSFLIAAGFTAHKWIVFASIKRERTAIATLRNLNGNNGVLEKEKTGAEK